VERGKEELRGGREGGAPGREAADAWEGAEVPGGEGGGGGARRGGCSDTLIPFRLLETTLSVRNVVPALTSSKRCGLSLDGQC
jgi:hypothetical protein